MMWFDKDEKKLLSEKIMEAARYFEDKYGQRATICLAHPDDLVNGGNVIQEGALGMRLESDRRVMRNHLWIGCEPDGWNEAVEKRRQNGV
ncbi:MAG: hypothetical protein AB1453_12120 [Chloroflexota bacterium]